VIVSTVHILNQCTGHCKGDALVGRPEDRMRDAIEFPYLKTNVPEYMRIKLHRSVEILYRDFEPIEK